MASRGRSRVPALRDGGQEVFPVSPRYCCPARRRARWSRTPRRCRARGRARGVRWQRFAAS
eukprot:15074074-Alexandrium_andersonii.AAC.1